MNITAKANRSVTPLLLFLFGDVFWMAFPPFYMSSLLPCGPTEQAGKLSAFVHNTAISAEILRCCTYFLPFLPSFLLLPFPFVSPCCGRWIA
jgi:hypothetical protein